MFSLLRRNKKSKNKDSKASLCSPKDLGSDVSATIVTGKQTPTETTVATGRYRPFSESERESGLPTVVPKSTRAATPKRAISRATIEELEDLQEEFDAETKLSDDEDECEVKQSREKTHGQAKRRERAVCDDDEQEKVNLAKTAASFTPNVAPAPVRAPKRKLTKNSKSNSATKKSNKTSAFTRDDVDRINNIAALCAADGVGSTIGDGPIRANARRDGSQNEEAEWQGHVSQIGTSERRIIKGANEQAAAIAAEPHQEFNNSNTDRTAAIGAGEDARESVAQISSSSSINSASASTRNRNTNPATNSAAAAAEPTTADRVINEVTYRNLDKKHSEQKRQSRLSLTLGLGKSKSKNDFAADSKPSSQTAIEVGQSVRKSFLRHKTKNIDHVLTPTPAKCDQEDDAPSGVSHKEANKKLSSLQKSKEFLSDIFMARGRNHNRNRNNGNHLKQQATPSGQQQPQEPCKYAAVSHFQNNNPSLNLNHNNSDANVTTCTPYSTAHLEQRSDPAVNISTNSYQITMSNNSAKNFVPHEVDAKRLAQPERQQPQRSNSAEHFSRGGLSRSGARIRCFSENTEREIPAGGALRELTTNRHRSSSWLNAHNFEESPFIHASNSKQHEVNTATEDQNNITDTNSDTAEQRRDQLQSIDRDADPLHSPSYRDGSGEKRQLHELTECDRDSYLNTDRSCGTNDNRAPMGQTSGKPEPTPSGTPRSSSPREFRESCVPETESAPLQVLVPTITVVDYGDDGTDALSSGGGSPVEQEVFYDFENVNRVKSATKINGGVQITAVDEHEFNSNIDEGIDTEIPATVYDFKNRARSRTPSSSPTRRNTKLENVPEEQAEDENNLDSELLSNQFDSPERCPLKSGSASDSNLSTSCPDSGIGESQTAYLPSFMPPLSAQFSRLIVGDNDPVASQSTLSARMPFVRDGNSTDCDETLLQCDDLDYVSELEVNERLVCIESISLPDVVVESTNAGSSNTQVSGYASTAAGGEQIVNINGATGNSIGNVHFIPIQVEGGDALKHSPQKRGSVDDSDIGRGAKFTAFNQKPTIEIVEDSSELQRTTPDGVAVDKLKRDLNEQKSRFTAQLDDAQKNVKSLQSKVDDMQTKIEKLEIELSEKAWNVERLQGELNAAHKDDEYVRKKLKLLEDEKTNLRHKHCEDEDEFKKKIEELEKQYKELEEKYKQTHNLASNLQKQLAEAQSDAEEWHLEVEKVQTELDEQTMVLRNALENSEAERKICEDKWQREFEMLRTQNMEREEMLIGDCEWQMRNMQKQCKEKIDKTEYARRDALQKAADLEEELIERQQEVNNLRVCQAEVNALRGVVNEQNNSISSLMEQIEVLKSEVLTSRENLHLQLEASKKMKFQCDNAVRDKERQMVYRIDEVRNEAAAFWEHRLHTEMTRLKNELESVYVDERREALDKLQIEHVEELRVLTTRFTSNEEELREELAELHERFARKSEEFLELRDKSDNTLLQTRMHLDRADREFQNAMFREEERREALEASLRKEFETEKEEMEEKFRERLDQVKEEFARELRESTQEMRVQHRKELENQKAKLQAEKEQAMQELSERHRNKLAAAEEQMKQIELQQQRDLKELKEAYDDEKIMLDKRDISNANEIEQLHRKCRCLTNLFEEMRMRYERREPRPEDLREIDELRSRCEAQERDLYDLTEKLRDMQNQMSELQQNGDSAKKQGKQIKKPPPKTIPTNCDVIYEDENEERESPPPQHGNNSFDETTSEDADEDEGDSESSTPEDSKQRNGHAASPSPPKEIIPAFSDLKKPNKFESNNEDDSHMITAM